MSEISGPIGVTGNLYWSQWDSCHWIQLGQDFTLFDSEYVFEHRDHKLSHGFPCDNIQFIFSIKCMIK